MRNIPKARSERDFGDRPVSRSPSRSRVQTRIRLWLTCSSTERYFLENSLCTSAPSNEIVARASRRLRPISIVSRASKKCEPLPRVGCLAGLKSTIIDGRPTLLAIPSSQIKYSLIARFNSLFRFSGNIALSILKVRSFLASIFEKALKNHEYPCSFPC